MSAYKIKRALIAACVAMARSNRVHGDYRLIGLTDGEKEALGQADINNLTTSQQRKIIRRFVNDVISGKVRMRNYFRPISEPVSDVLEMVRKFGEV